MPRVLNKYKDVIPKDAVYIGRPSIWGNPHPKTKTCTRQMSIRMFSQYLDNHPDLKAKARRDLAGKDLVCFCKPLECHGDILLTVANEPDQT